jgi:hypothetical protein
MMLVVIGLWGWPGAEATESLLSGAIVSAANCSEVATPTRTTTFSRPMRWSSRGVSP